MVPARRLPAASPSAASVPASPGWSAWPLKVQTLQVDAAMDMLGVFGRHLAALAGARDAQAVGEAQRTFAAEWLACIEQAQREWAQLALLVPPEAWNAIGWRLKPASRGVGASPPVANDRPPVQSTSRRKPAGVPH